MDLNLSGKNALVTGSTKGIGLSIANFLSREGCNVAINSRNINERNSENNKFNSFYKIQGDVTNPTDSDQIIRKMINNFGSLDILICNVGSGKSVVPGNENYAEWQKIFHKNLFSATNIIESSKNYLINSKGCIVCISSICGLETIPGAPITYSVAKSALNTYVKQISKIYAEYNVRVNAIAPGNILFEESVWDKKLESNPAEVQKYIKTNVPLNKFGSPEDIAKLTCYLCSPLADFITGSIFKIDGGQIRS